MVGGLSWVCWVEICSLSWVFEIDVEEVVCDMSEISEIMVMLSGVREVLFGGVAEVASDTSV